MAQPQTAAARELLLYLQEPGVSPAQFIFACGINSKSLNGTLNTSEAPLQDCDDPTGLAVRRVVANWYGEELTGTGLLAKEIFETFEEVYRSGAAHNWRIGVEGFGYWQGPFVMTARNVGGEAEGFVTVELTMMSDGNVTFTADPTFPS